MVNPALLANFRNIQKNHRQLLLYKKTVSLPHHVNVKKQTNDARLNFFSNKWHYLSPTEDCGTVFEGGGISCRIVNRENTSCKRHTDERPFFTYACPSFLDASSFGNTILRLPDRDKKTVGCMGNKNNKLDTVRNEAWFDLTSSVI
jgi:hypothetical protein